MSLVGTLSTMALPDLLQWLAGAGKKGTLQVERNKLTKWVQIAQGRVVGCSSDDPPQRLGQFLLSRELITPDQLRQALALQRSSAKHLGTILVELGALSGADLARHLEAKAEETIFSVFDWNEGVFRFEEGLAPREDLFAVNLPIQDMLLRGLKRYDDMRRIRQVFDDPRIILRYTETPPGPDIFSNRMARTMYSAIDGDRSLAEILLHVHGSEYAVYKFLFELHRNGYVEIAGRKTAEEPGAEHPLPAWAPPAREVPAIVGMPEPVAVGAAGVGPGRPLAATAVASAPFTGRRQPEPPAGSLESQLAQARGLMAEAQLEAALDLLDGLYRQRPQDESLKRLTAEAEAAFIDRAYRYFVPPDKIPTLLRPMESLAAESLSPQEFFLLSRIDGKWDVKSIIQVAPLREVDALRTLKRMREIGMIELHDPRT